MIALNVTDPTELNLLNKIDQDFFLREESIVKEVYSYQTQIHWTTQS